ncbi:LLM class flavin-dependent oxidoreductase [Amycolatopsis rifamycinica]|uniref:MmcJ protein n=1 Tax=Amycolatopsis rifamycinica TaxID=287986 RepID=A0A066U8F8_9PSEU|nr:LLM class flavin-dependent oxidoreductase [Amycolatopsis rifamycinica]KDN22132.1 MmcJ protein [Amycolatopsis rifamycinica]
MRIGIGLPNQVRDVNPQLIPSWAKRAEELGFASLGTVGRYAYPGVSDTVTLAAAAGATTEIALLSTVLVAPAWPAALLAKEVAGIDGVSGGRLTLGVGVGMRADDFVADGYGLRDRGKRFDDDLAVYREVWDGAAVGGGTNPAVPAGTRRVPLLFGGFSPAALARAAREGDGYIGGSMPVEMVGQSFDAARAAWKEAGREDPPRLVGIAYFALGDVERGRAGVHDYYSFMGDDTASMIAGTLSGGTDAVRATVKAFDELGADELVLNPTVADLDEVSRLADAVL